MEVTVKIRNLSVAVALISLFAFAGQAQTKRSEIANPSDFLKIETEASIPICRKTLRSCGEAVLTTLDLAGFGGPDTIKYKTETFLFGNGVSIYLFTMTGLEDDSITGERLRVAFLKTKQGYRFVQIGRQFQCARGKNAGSWTRELCP